MWSGLYLFDEFVRASPTMPFKKWIAKVILPSQQCFSCHFLTPHSNHKSYILPFYCILLIFNYFSIFLMFWCFPCTPTLLLVVIILIFFSIAFVNSGHVYIPVLNCVLAGELNFSPSVGVPFLLHKRYKCYNLTFTIPILTWLEMLLRSDYLIAHNIN